MTQLDFDIDLVPGGVPPVVNISQYDTGVLLHFFVYDSGKPCEAPDNATIWISGKGGANPGFELECSWEQGMDTLEVRVPVDLAMSYYAGEVSCLLTIKAPLSVLASGCDVVSSAVFTLRVQRAPVQQEDIVSGAGFAGAVETAFAAYLEAHGTGGESGPVQSINKKTGAVVLKVSDLENDSDYAPKSQIPTRVSDLENDAGYLTQHQDLSCKADVLANRYPAPSDPVVQELLDCMYSYMDHASALCYAPRKKYFILHPEAITGDDYPDAASQTKRRPIHCAWFAWAVTSGIRYEYSFWNGRETNARYYDWGFDWAGLDDYYEQERQPFEDNWTPLAGRMAHYCADKGLGFAPAADFSNLRTGDLLFFSRPADYPDAYRGVHHIAVFLYRDAAGRIYLADVSSEEPEGYHYPVRVKRYAPGGSTLEEVALCARLPYVADRAPGVPENLFANEADYRGAAVTLPDGAASIAVGRLADGAEFQEGRFYTFVLCADRPLTHVDSVALRSGGAGEVILDYDAALPVHPDGVYAFHLYMGTVKNGVDDLARFTVDGKANAGVQFRLRSPEDPTQGSDQSLTVRWIACYEGIRRVGAHGFAPYQGGM